MGIRDLGRESHDTVTSAPASSNPALTGKAFSDLFRTPAAMNCGQIALRRWHAPKPLPQPARILRRKAMSNRWDSDNEVRREPNNRSAETAAMWFQSAT